VDRPDPGSRAVRPSSLNGPRRPGRTARSVSTPTAAGGSHRRPAAGRRRERPRRTR
jgi:hypothetical protein